MNEQAEEKKLPASDKKLREGRRKGQVSHSRDLISGFTLVAALVYLFYAWNGFMERLNQLVETVISWPESSFEATSAQALHHSVLVVATALVPVAILVVVFTIALSMFVTGGPVFAVEPIKPRFDHINPAKGIKRIFSLRILIEFTKGLTKILLLSALFFFIFLAWLQSLLEAPSCGAICLEQVFKSLLMPIGGAAALTFIVTGVIDLFLQRWLFLRDMRMTRSEYKRERKDLEGDPQIRQERFRQRHASASGETVKAGIRHANIVFFDDGRLIALRYIRGETSVPVVVAKSRGEGARKQLIEAQRYGLAVADDQEALDLLFPNSAVGDAIDQSAFAAVVRNLVRFNLV